MYVSVAFSETPPSAIVPYTETKEQKAVRVDQKKAAWCRMVDRRFVAAYALERTKGLKAKWQATVKELQHDIDTLEASLKAKRKKLANAEGHVQQKNKVIFTAENERNTPDMQLVLIKEQLDQLDS